MKHFAIFALSLLGSTFLFGSHPVKFETQLLAVDANEGVAVADYDKDGKLDVSAGRNWYRNPGKSGAWVPRSLRIIEDKGGLPIPMASMLMMSMGTDGSTSYRIVFGCPK
jgi:hypothetical protein